MISSLENHDRTALARSAPQQKLERVGCTEQLIYHLLCYSMLSRIIFRHHVVLLLPCSTTHSLQSISECRKMQDSGCHVQESTQVRYSTVYSIYICIYICILCIPCTSMRNVLTWSSCMERTRQLGDWGLHSSAACAFYSESSQWLRSNLFGEQTQLSKLISGPAILLQLAATCLESDCSDFEMQNSAKPAQHGARSSRQDYKTLKCQGKYKSTQIKGTFVCTSRSSSRTPGCDLSLWALVNA